jgi:hypothetical protein
MSSTDFGVSWCFAKLDETELVCPQLNIGKHIPASLGTEVGLGRMAERGEGGKVERLSDGFSSRGASRSDDGRFRHPDGPVTIITRQSRTSSSEWRLYVP